MQKLYFKKLWLSFAFIVCSCFTILNLCNLPVLGAQKKPTTEDNKPAKKQPKISTKSTTLLQDNKTTLKVLNYKGKVKWSSNKPDIVSINSKGTITAVSPGIATITATANKKKYTCKVTVPTPTLLPYKQHIAVGETVQISVKDYNKPINFTSSDPLVASVDNTGLITGKKNGSTDINVNFTQGSFTCRVTVDTPAMNTFMETLSLGQTYQLELVDSVDDTTWESMHPSIATVSSTGLVKAIAPGKTSISVKSGNSVYSCIIIVSDLSSNKEQALIQAGDYTYFNIAGTMLPIDWYSTNSSVATVLWDGRVTGVTPGTVSIIAISGGRSKIFTVTVERLELNHKALAMNVDDSLNLCVYGTSRTVEWISSDTDVIDVEPDGLIYAFAPGTATVSAIIGGTHKVNCVITVTGDSLE